MFSVSIDQPNAMIRVELFGFFKQEDVAKFGAEERAAARVLRREVGEFDLLIETAGRTVQSPDIMSEFFSLIMNATPKARHVAIVSTSALQRMQLKRTLPASHIQVFESADDAQSWLGKGRSQSAP